MGELSFALVEQACPQPFTKRYPITLTETGVAGALLLMSARTIATGDEVR